MASEGGTGGEVVDAVSIESSSRSQTVKRCRNIDDENKGYILDNCIIYNVPGDGSCLFGACAAAIYQDEHQAKHLRRLTNCFIVENFWYYQDFISIPFIEHVGVGGNQRQIFSFYSIDQLQRFLSEPRPQCYTLECHSLDVLHFYLQSVESEKCWSNSQV